MIRIWFSTGQYVASGQTDVLDAVACAIGNPLVRGRVIAVTHGEDPMDTAKALGFR